MTKTNVTMLLVRTLGTFQETKRRDKYENLVIYMKGKLSKIEQMDLFPD